MLKAVSPSRIFGWLVKCALAAGLVLWAPPVRAQEGPVICGPADAVREFLEGQGVRITGTTTLLDGDTVEVWESETRIVFTIAIRNPKEPTRCLVKTLQVVRQGRGA